jgi:hypothetical protein
MVDIVAVTMVGIMAGDIVAKEAMAVDIGDSWV